MKLSSTLILPDITMCRTVIPYFALLCLLVACQPNQALGRISQTKCEEYRNLTKVVSEVIPLILTPKPLKFETFNCSRTIDLIVGGVNAKEKEFPHQALLGWSTQDAGKYDFRCGGSLISEQYVLTAAHCTVLKSLLQNKNNNSTVLVGQPPVIVRMAELNLTNEYGNQVDFNIANITRHEEYKFSQSYHDIALIKLKEKVRFSDFIRPACLWDSVQLNVTSVIATGFGHTMYGSGMMSDTLRKVQLNALDRSKCEEVVSLELKFPRGVTEHQMCYGSKKGGRDTCQGDSGGPIQVLTDSADCTFYIVGITSTGVSCGKADTPAIYTRVSSYIDWIESVVWP